MPLRVTLLTGDRVSLASADAERIAVRPAKGREHVRFLVRRDHGTVYVVPSDAQRLVQAGKLDRRLFDVAGLVRAGYHDGARDTVPLIVRYRPGAARTAGNAFAATGARVVRDLPAVGGAAVRADKSRAGEFWARITAGTAALRADTAGGVDRIWLDGQRQISLDHSVPQIGAPAAWQAGYTGKGVTVAVLDTGVDATHPDLAGRIAEAVNFSEAPDATDGVGHGTHVASTIVGSGAASGGRYKGVAPDATLVAGKVCGSSFCEESAILAGMQWAAAEKHATAVNLSLGGADGPGIDPVEEAVNSLTEQYGTLFVVAAGNAGDQAGTISSPASADAALAVGAVDREDQLADFSSRGPRAGDDAVKPDLTAPGVDIVAARASGTMLGAPVDEHYVAASGTSMATPHVAGAVALLAQRHPDWTARRLKSILVGSAKPTAGLSAYEQGAGRVDVAAAIARDVTTDPVSLSFGRATWPHGDDAPITRTVRYHNPGSAPITFALSVQALGPDGKAAPAETFTPSAGTVTVPAGGDAEVSVVANTAGTGPDGYYSGSLLATAGSTVVTTPIAVNKEVESYDLDLTMFDGTGGVPEFGDVLLFGLDDGGIVTPTFDGGVAKVRVPRGTYNLTAVIFTARSDTEGEGTLLVRPTLNVTADAAITVDARAGRPVALSVPDPTAEALLADVSYLHRTEAANIGISLLSGSPDGLFVAQLGPARTVAGFTSSITSQWARPGAGGTAAESPYLYALGESFAGRLPTGYERHYQARDLATVRQEFGSAVPGLSGERVVFPVFDPDMGGSAAVLPLPSSGRRIEYHSTDRVRWTSEVDFGTYDEDGWLVPRTVLLSGPTGYRSGREYRDEWNHAPFGLALPDGGARAYWAARLGDLLHVDLPLYSDRAGHIGFSRTDTSRTALYRDGALVGETDASGYGDFEVPAGAADYRLEVADTRSVGDLSTRVSGVWTFRSGHVDGDEPVRLPVSAVRFTPRLAADNSAPAGRAFEIPVSVERQYGASGGRVRSLTVEVSYDDGATWQRAEVRGGVARVRHPAKAGFVSLRAGSTDTAGNSVSQTIVHAYRIR